MQKNTENDAELLGLSMWAERIRRSQHTVERLRLTADFLHQCETALRHSDCQGQYEVFAEVAHLLADRVCDAEIWDWLQETARSADLGQQIHMRIAVLELVPAPPINWHDLFRLWDMWFDERARWAVWAAYFPFPKRVRRHLRRYIAHRNRQGHAIPEFSEIDFATVQERHKGQQAAQPLPRAPQTGHSEG